MSGIHPRTAVAGFLVIALVPALASPSLAAKRPKTTEGGTPATASVPAEEHTLANGMKIVLVPRHLSPTVAGGWVAHVGSANERPGITGISHLFEHMMFNGSKKYGPKEFDRRLEAAGGTSNAYTSNDLTAYYEDFASEALPLVLDLEADRMASLLIDDASLAREREVVKEERRFRTDNDIDGMLDEALGALAFLAHPYHWPVIGWMSDIEGISRGDCERYFRTYYAPNNCTLVLVGDFEPAAALSEIERLYGPIPPGESPPPVATAEPPQKGERRAVIRYPSQAPALLAGFRGPAGRDPDSLVLDLIETALSSGEGARLKRALVYEQELCVDARVYFGWRMDPGLFEISLKLAPGVDPGRAESALWAELGRICERQISDRELDRAKNMVRAQLLRGLATTNGRAHTIGQMEVMLGEWRAMLDLPDRYASIAAADIQRVAQKTFAAHRRNVVTLIPGEVEE
jgi:predicted Zn-dependent peptidase